MSDPALEDYWRILDGLIRSILPLERPEFPLSADQVRSRLLALFRLEEDARFLGLQRALVLFDQTDLFTARLVPAHEEATALDCDARGLDLTSVLAGSHAFDGGLYRGFARGEAASQRFIQLTVARQREYLDLWRRSSYLIRRQFYASARSLVMISAYSMDALWPAIAYSGPLFTRDGT